MRVRERHGANERWVTALGVPALSVLGERGPRSLADFGAVASQRVDFQDGRDRVVCRGAAGNAPVGYRELVPAPPLGLRRTPVPAVCTKR